MVLVFTIHHNPRMFALLVVETVTATSVWQKIWTKSSLIAGVFVQIGQTDLIGETPILQDVT